MKYLLILSIFILSALNNKSTAQFSSIELYGTKSNGLGSISTTFNDINSAYTNQAGLTNIKGLATNISYGNRFSILGLGELNFAIAKNFNKYGTLAVSIKKFGLSEFNEIQLGTAYAMKLSKSVSIGLQINLFNISIEDYGNKSMASFETGVLYELTKTISIGFHVSNPFPINFLNTTNLPTIASIGLKYKISDYLIYYGEISKHFNYDFFIKSGIEYAPIKAFAIYLGFKNNLKDYADYSMGIMYEIDNKIKFEISTLWNFTLGMSPSVGLTYDLQ